MTSMFELLGVATLAGSVLVILSIVLGAITARLGLPLLLIFLVVGMLAGEDGPGAFAFNNYELSFWIANIALAVILLDGGLKTSMSIFRVALKPAVLLSTLGVLVSCIAIAGLAFLVFSMPLPIAFLFGAIVSSTDAAAVFSLLKNSGIRLNERVEATLEIESGVNDPMAIFLTLLAISFISQGISSLAEVQWLKVLFFLAQQVGLGLAASLLCSFVFIRLVRKLKIDASHQQGLNAILILAAGLATFGLSSLLGGSGFLAIYLFGLLVANFKTRFVKAVIPSLDGLAWLFQAAMFLLLGLLVTPSSLINSILPGLGLALLLIFIARPLAVFACLLPFGFSLKENLFVAWVGLRGAVPIVLAIFPVIAGVDEERLMLDLALLVVISSLLIQGSSMGWIANKLGLVIPDRSDIANVRKIFGIFTLDGNSAMKDVANVYGIHFEGDGLTTLEEWLTEKIGKPPVVGDTVKVAETTFVVKEMKGDRISKVGAAT
jgi:cell volume regulation protein A